MAVKRVYEAMFLFDPTAGANWARVEEQIKRLMERADGELIKMKKWDERRLTYEVEGRKRGLYVLATFKAPTDRIVGMERDVQLSEEILRVLILCRDHMSDEKATELVDKAEAYVAPPHHEGYGYGGYGSREGSWGGGRDSYGSRDREGGGGYRRDREGYAPRGERPVADIPGIEDGGDEVPAGK